MDMVRVSSTTRKSHHLRGPHVGERARLGETEFGERQSQASRQSSIGGEPGLDFGENRIRIATGGHSDDRY
jgi:hypothetical protein